MRLLRRILVLGDDSGLAVADDVAGSAIGSDDKLELRRPGLEDDVAECVGVRREDEEVHIA